MLDRQARNRAIDSGSDDSLKGGRPETESGKERGYRLAPGQPSDGKKLCRDSRPRSPLPCNGMPEGTFRGLQPGPVCCSGCPFGGVKEWGPASTEWGAKVIIPLSGSARTSVSVVGTPGNLA